MTAAERMKHMTELLDIAESIGMAEVTFAVEDFKLVINQAQTNQVSIIKQKNGIPTVIEYQGDRFTYNSPTTFIGGVQHGKSKAAK